MTNQSDTDLLREYVLRGSDAAFSEIVHRYTNLVYSVSVRHLHSDEGSSEVTQSVFIALSRKARSLLETPRADHIAGWLFTTARYAALKYRRDTMRRKTLEKRAFTDMSLHTTPQPEWPAIESVLDEALAALKEEDRCALLLRFFREHDLRSIGRTLGISEDAAQKRVARAIERLREALATRGVVTPGGALAGTLTTHAIASAPPGLASGIASAVVARSAAHTASTIKGLFSICAQKPALVLTLAASALIVAAIATKHVANRKEPLASGGDSAALTNGAAVTASTKVGETVTAEEENRRLRADLQAATNRLARYKQQLVAQEKVLLAQSNQLQTAGAQIVTNRASLNLTFTPQTLQNAGGQSLEQTLQTALWSLASTNVEAFAAIVDTRKPLFTDNGAYIIFTNLLDIQAASKISIGGRDDMLDGTSRFMCELAYPNDSERWTTFLTVTIGPTENGWRVTEAGNQRMELPDGSPVRDWLTATAFDDSADQTESALQRGDLAGIGVNLGERESADEPLRLSDTLKSYPAELAGVETPCFLISVNGTNVVNTPLPECRKMIVGSTGSSLVIEVADLEQKRTKTYTLNRVALSLHANTTDN